MHELLDQSRSTVVSAQNYVKSKSPYFKYSINKPLHTKQFPFMQTWLVQLRFDQRESVAFKAWQSQADVAKADPCSRRQTSSGCSDCNCGRIKDWTVRNG